eukprot:TRINITY_DN51955_c0_g1_i1.p2 TRINITY_DN51955_c0_g1~~TRINITY_DN51955_c0_g1_i1.p2  ORF type:complete len:148 (+),score=22.08 TRINITY_DN51955_c0_g1_i1:92-535(+)
MRAFTGLALLASLLVQSLGQVQSLGDWFIRDGIVYPYGWRQVYFFSLTSKKILIWGGDIGRGKEMAKIAHLRCAVLLIVGQDPAVTEAAATEILSEKPTTGTCPPAVDPSVFWDVGDIANATFVLHLTDRYESTLGGSPEIAWNFVA